MLKRFSLICIIGLLCAAMFSACGTTVPDNTGAEHGYDIVDIQGTKTHMPAKPARIVTLSMETDEILLGLVPPDRLAAVNVLLDDPGESTVAPLAVQIPKKIVEPSVESIAALQPDLVIVPDWGNLEIVGPLRDLGLPVVVCKGAKNVSEVKETVALVAAAIDEQGKGEAMCQKMDAELDAVKTKVDAIPGENCKSIVLISLMNTYGGIGCIFDDDCRYAGVKNGMAEAGIHNGQPMSKEMLVKINPDYLFLPSYTDHGQYDPERFIREYMDDPALRSMKAIRENHLVKPRESYIYNGSQDCVYGVREIAYVVYGNDFSQADGRHISVVDE